MTLDSNTEQFSDAIRAASEHLNIAPIYIEKDYWITKILQQLSRTPQANNRAQNDAIHHESGGGGGPGAVRL